MGLFSSIKKAFKKVVKGVKKVVKKVVKGVKKVVKKIGSSKILKALAIAAAVVVTGGAALTAFGGTGALATSKLGAFMMNASGKMLGGTVFTGGGTLAKVGNFAIKTASKPFGAIGGALGSTARVGANLLTGQPAFQAGPGVGGAATTPGAVVTAPKPFSAEAFSGQAAVSNTVSYDDVAKKWISTDATTGVVTDLTQAQIDSLPSTFIGNPSAYVTPAAGTETTKYLTGNKWGDFALKTGTGVAASVATGVATAKIMEGDPSGQMAGLANESKEYQDKLQVFAENNSINLDDIYGQLTYGTADPMYQMSSDLYKQDTVGVPA